jgi:hypothetical protein
MHWATLEIFAVILYKPQVRNTKEFKVNLSFYFVHGYSLNFFLMRLTMAKKGLLERMNILDIDIISMCNTTSTIQF